MSSFKKIYIGFSFLHHKGTFAGYDKIKNYLKYDLIISSQVEHEWLNYNNHNIISKIIRKIYRFFFGSLYLYTYIQCLFLYLFNRNQVFHFVYAENNYHKLKYFNFFKNNNIVICTFHQPLSSIKKDLGLVKSMKDIDKVILVTKEDVEETKQFLNNDNVYFIPHGINTDFFVMPTNCHRSNVIMVGNWLRDFEFANQVFQQLFKINNDVKVTVITNSDNFKYFDQNERLELATKISDIELLHYYQKSACLFLPLTAFTANNAILEAASSGCPILIASNDTNLSYFNDEQIDFVEFDLDKVVTILNEKVNMNYNREKALMVREYVLLNYSWDVIAKKTEDLFV